MRRRHGRVRARLVASPRRAALLPRDEPSRGWARRGPRGPPRSPTCGSDAASPRTFLVRRRLRRRSDSKYARNTHGMRTARARPAASWWPRPTQDPIRGWHHEQGAPASQFQDLLEAAADRSNLLQGVRKTLVGRVLRTKCARASGAWKCHPKAASAYFVRTFCASRIVRCGHPNRTE